MGATQVFPPFPEWFLRSKRRRRKKGNPFEHKILFCAVITFAYLRLEVKDWFFLLLAALTFLNFERKINIGNSRQISFTNVTFTNATISFKVHQHILIKKWAKDNTYSYVLFHHPNG